MKKLVVVVIAAMSAVSLMSETSKGATDSAVEMAVQKEAARKKALMRTGGLIEKPGSGKVAVVNCQSRYARTKLAEWVGHFQGLVRVNFELIDGEPVNAKNVFDRMATKPAGAAVAIYVIDDPTLPISLYAMESQWMCVNVAGLTDRQADCEILRGTSMALGSWSSCSKASPMRTAVKPADLDAIVCRDMAFDTLGSIMSNLEALGVTARRKMAYRKACMEGWAPAPTNEYQKAVWNLVHELPSKPLPLTK